MTLTDHIRPNQRVEVTVWRADDDNDENGTSFETKVIRSFDGLVMIADTLSGKPFIRDMMMTGVRIGMVIYSLDKPIIVYPVIQSYQEKPPKGWWTKIDDAENIQTVQERQYVRIQISLPVKIEWQQGDNINDYQTLRVQMIDISGGGMKILGSKLFPKDTLFDLTFKLDEDTPTLTLPAKVVYPGENKMAETMQEKFFAACEFQEVSDADRTLIMAWCFKKELEERQKKADKGL